MTPEYTILLNGAPLPAAVTGAITRVEMEEATALASALRITLATSTGGGEAGFGLVDGDLFPRLAALRLDVTLNGERQTLIDARLAERKIVIGAGGTAQVQLVALDRSLEMNLEEKARAWPGRSDADVARAIFSAYDLRPVVSDTAPAAGEGARMQRSTDAQFLRALARRQGFSFYVGIDPISAEGFGHFGPPDLSPPAQKPIGIGLGPDDALSSLTIDHDLLRPASGEASFLALDDLSVTDASARKADGVVLGATADEARRTVLSADGAGSVAEQRAATQGAVNRLAFAISADGTLDSRRYGALLRARKTVGLRGAGKTYSGVWFVERVLHVFSNDTYEQQFTLRRNGTGTRPGDRLGAERS